MQKLEELIAALEKSTGPDRELDTQIWLLFTDGATRRTTHVKSATNQWAPYDIDETRDETGKLIIVPAYTASIDAAVTLIARVLPNANCWGIDKDERGVEAHVQRNGVATGHWAQFAEHPTSPAIALCIAALRAKLSQENDNADK